MRARYPSRRSLRNGGMAAGSGTGLLVRTVCNRGMLRGQDEPFFTAMAALTAGILAS
jgi:hypothetical protein